MPTESTPEARFTFAAVTANGIPMMFVWDPAARTVRYYDRRHPVQQGKPGYGINHATELGQCCGPALSPDSFRPDTAHGFKGWHEVTAWDIDANTARLVGLWLMVNGFAHTDRLPGNGDQS